VGLCVDLVMKNYYRIMLGKKGMHADACHDGNFIQSILIFIDMKLSSN